MTGMLLKTHRVNIMMTDVLVKKTKKTRKNGTGCLGFRTQGEEGEWKENRQEREMLHSSWKKSSKRH